MSLLALVAITAGAPRPAHACGDGGSGDAVVLILGGGTVVLGTNTALTIHDLAVDDSSRGYGVAETVLTVPQVLLGGALFNVALEERSGEGMVLAAGYTAWVSVLAWHGIREMLEDDDEAAETPPPGTWQLGKARVTVAPTAVSDGVELGTGLGVVGVF